MQCQKLKTYMETGRVVFLPAKAICPNPFQPRKVFQEEQLAELTESIRRHGILQPLSVRRAGTRYELITGERRLRAAVLAGLTEIPCIVMQMSEEESAMAALVENLQRQDLDFVEEAQGIDRLLRQFSMSQEQVARLLGKSQSGVANKLRLLRHSPKVLEALRQAGLTERHARALLRISEEKRSDTLDYIIAKQLTLPETEEYIDRLLSPKKEKTEPVRKCAIGDVRLFANSLTKMVDTMRLGGVNATTKRLETETHIEYTVLITK